MAEGGTFTFSDADGYAAGFGDARIGLTITGAGDFEAGLTRLRLQHLEVFRCHENLPRIAHISLPPDRIYVSFPVAKASFVSDGRVVRSGEMVLHGLGESMHQRSDGACEWGLISLSPEQFERYSKALTGQEIALTGASRILRPARPDLSRFQRLLKNVCQLAEKKQKLIERPEVARALEEELLRAIVNCMSAGETCENPRTRHFHAAAMVRLEQELSRRVDEKLSMPKLSAAVGVPERTLRMYCTKFLGVSPTRYLLLRRLNKARSALRRADPSAVTVAEVARNHQFLELGRFAVTYRATFGESPSATLERHR
jgi:AraC-like DNA-binding protein